MSRPLAGFAPDLTILPARRAPLLELNLAVVTPMFGGGALAREADRERPISGKAVRGSLRFWWRACRGAGYTTVQDLFKAEAAIWGSTKCPAAVEVEVEISDKGRNRDFDDWRSDKDMPRYGLFPFFPQPARNGEPGKPAATCLEGVRFHLRLTGPEAHCADVEAAVWAWIMFGGVGARTRRGCGTLFCEEARFRPTRDGLLPQAERHVLSGVRRLPVPLLAGGQVLVAKEIRQLETPKQSWATAVVAMQEFRQRPGFARNPGPQPNRPKRSRWPEADSIRDIADQAAGRRLTLLHPPAHPARRFFPRADLGLPIVFHFINEPYGETLQPLATEQAQSRMASPIILKALPLSAKTAVPMAICLNAPHVWDADAPCIGFKGRVARPHAEIDQISDPARNAQVPPMGGRTVRDAFWEFAKDEWGSTGSGWDGLEIMLP